MLTNLSTFPKAVKVRLKNDIVSGGWWWLVVADGGNETSKTDWT
jgi:hypothetical protein